MNIHHTNQHFLVRSIFEAALPPRAVDAHKGSNGSIAIIGGDNGMVGAVLLCSRAALMTGAGRIYAAILSDEAPVVDLLHPEIMMHSACSLTQLSQLNCVVIGPGLGTSSRALELLEFCLVQNVSLLLDADALNLIAVHSHLSDLVKHRSAETIITPHPGEAARLLAISASDIQKNRKKFALKLAKSLHVTCVLKGAGSICAHHDGSWFINTTGNPGLASGGTGDVLSGIIGSLVAQGLNTLEAAKLGVYAHGAAADSLVERNIGPVGLTASEVAEEVRHIINTLNKAKPPRLKLSYQD
ncbi:MAG: NAD(P)H-hydrate dehydratase [Methylophilaceae bacterium]|nr:NAD(P)H-hydrate dehydratase [Methylophilaceae bacterium]